MINIYNYFIKPYELNKFQDRVKLVPSIAYGIATKLRDKNKFREMWPGGLECIAKDPQLACMYTYRSGERFIEAEPNIAKHASTSNFYAQAVIGGRWEPGEPAIKTEDTVWQTYIKFLKDNNKYPKNGI